MDRARAEENYRAQKVRENRADWSAPRRRGTGRLFGQKERPVVVLRAALLSAFAWAILGCGKSAPPDQFDEFRKRDWYEDRKRQEQIKARSDFIIAWIRQKDTDDPRPSGSKKFQQI